MALHGSNLMGNNKNYFSFHARNPKEGNLPNISDLILDSEHTLVIDSSNRDLIHYPNPAKYNITFPESYKNVTSLELRGAMFPKAETNVNSSNYIIPFNIDDSVTGITISDPGFGYTDGIYSSTGSDVSISAPALSGGVQAEITVTVSGNTITNVVVDTAGSGYLRGFYGNKDDNANGFYLNSHAIVTLSIAKEDNLSDRHRDAILEVNVGSLLLAKMNFGQYDFTSPDNTSGLCTEIERAINAAAGGTNFLCTLTTGTVNASPLNRVTLTKDNDPGPFFELLWASAGESIRQKSAMNLLGFGSTILQENKDFPPVDQTSGQITPATPGTGPSGTVTARNDYNLYDSTEFFTMELGEHDFDRIESNNDQLEKSFATLLFDANQSNVIWRAANETNSDFSTFLTNPGVNKPLKGYEYDTKKIIFTQPLAELKNLSIDLKKTNGEYYNFQGRDHVLIFSVKASDINTGGRF